MSKPTREDKASVLKRIARAALASRDYGLLASTILELSDYEVTSWEFLSSSVVTNATATVYPVIVVKRFCDLDGNWSTHQRRVALPVPPANGMGIIFNPDIDPLSVELVFVNSKNEVVVCVESDDWSHEKGNFDGDWTSQREYQLDGWELITNNDCGIFQLY